MNKLNNKKQKGITLIALVTTIVVLLILAGVAINLIFGEDGIIEKAKFAKYSAEFNEVEEKIVLYWTDKMIDNVVEETVGNKKVEEQQKVRVTSRAGISVIEKNGEKTLPVKSKIGIDEKKKIKGEISTLAVKIQELSGKSIEEVNLYWVDLALIGAKVTHRYVIDIETRQLYNYEPEEIYGKMWHSLDGGVDADAKPEDMADDEIWDGWITLTLYYPTGSTERKWRLGAEGETRYDKNLSWQDYTGPITVRISEVENVWIKYKLNDEEVIIPPNGRVLVDIQPDSWYPANAEKIKVKIAYDKNAVLKEYKIGNSTWKETAEKAGLQAQYDYSENYRSHGRAVVQII